VRVEGGTRAQPYLAKGAWGRGSFLHPDRLAKLLTELEVARGLPTGLEAPFRIRTSELTCLISGPSSMDAVDRLARGLGWFSIGLSLVELAAPGRFAQALGIEGRESLLRAYGAREIAAGVMTLSPDKHLGLWSRVAGDGLDIATLLSAARPDNPKRYAVGLALAMVAGVTLLDIVGAQAASARRRRSQNGSRRSYRDRSGFAVMNWPNDEHRRELFTDAHSLANISPEWHDALNLAGIDDQRIDFRAVGQSTLDLLGPEYKRSQDGWRNAGDLFLTLVRLDATEDARIRGGTSIAKAKDLLEASSGVRRHGKEGSLIFLNLIAGWLLIPWVFVFVWAVVGETKSAEFVQ